MVNNLKKYLILFFSFFLLGCQNYKELNNSAIVSAIGIEKKENEYKITIQVIDTNKNENEQSNLNTPIVYTSSGNNISDALNNISLKSPKLLYLGHLEVVVISSNVASNGTNEIIDYFLRNNQINKNFTILVAKNNTPEEILNTPTPLVNFPSGNILGSVEISSTIGGASSNVKFINFVDNLKKEGKNPVMSSISLVNNNEEKTLQIDDLAVFSNDKLVGYLSREDTKGYNFITNNINTSVVNFMCNDSKYVGVNISNSKTDIKVSLKGENPIINLNVSADGDIVENNCNISLADIKNQTQMEIETIINDSIKKVKEEYQSDIFGFGNYIYLNNTGYFNKLKNKWDEEHFVKLKVNVKVDIAFNNTGNLLID